MGAVSPRWIVCGGEAREQCTHRPGGDWAFTRLQEDCDSFQLCSGIQGTYYDLHSVQWLSVWLDLTRFDTQLHL